MIKSQKRKRYVQNARKFVPKSGITGELAKNVARFEYNDIPSDLISIVKLSVLEAAGFMIAGALHGSSRKVLRYVRGLGGSLDATCIYYGYRTNIYNAALVNGTSCHDARESVVIPATLALAEKEIANGYDMITAITLGWEVTLRLAIAAAPTVPQKRPLNPISTFGPFGAAVAAGKILRLSSSDMENTITNSTAQAAGTLQSTITGGKSDRLVSGFAASYGLRAANWACKGISGARDILEGPAGFYMCICGLNDDGTPDFDVDKVNDGFGERWYIRDIHAMLAKEIEDKFKEHTTMAGIPNHMQERIIEIVNCLEEQDDVSFLISKLVREM